MVFNRKSSVSLLDGLGVKTSIIVNVQESVGIKVRTQVVGYILLSELIDVHNPLGKEKHEDDLVKLVPGVGFTTSLSVAHGVQEVNNYSTHDEYLGSEQ